MNNLLTNITTSLTALNNNLMTSSNLLLISLKEAKRIMELLLVQPEASQDIQLIIQLLKLHLVLIMIGVKPMKKIILMVTGIRL